MKTSFIAIAITALISNSSFSKDCSHLNGTYDLPSMAQSCTVSGIGYFPGDDSPLYTFLPGYETQSTNGYIEANTQLGVTASNDCSTVTLSYQGARKGGSQELVKMLFKVSKEKKGIVTIKSKRKDSGCDMGICGKSKETSTLKLSSSDSKLSLDVKKVTKGLIYFIPFKDKQLLDCSFSKID
jgi:hypothetical protein